jgi:hypothetical protein
MGGWIPSQLLFIKPSFFVCSSHGCAAHLIVILVRAENSTATAAATFKGVFLNGATCNALALLLHPSARMGYSLMAMHYANILACLSTDTNHKQAEHQLFQEGVIRVVT